MRWKHSRNCIQRLCIELHYYILLLLRCQFRTGSRVPFSDGHLFTFPCGGATITVVPFFYTMKQFAEKFYASQAWKDCRKAYKKSVGGLCERCLKQGIFTPGEIVHHKVHLDDQNINDPMISLNWNNLQLVCRECHADLHGPHQRYKVMSDGSIQLTE